MNDSLPYGDDNAETCPWEPDVPVDAPSKQCKLEVAKKVRGGKN